LIKFLKVCIFGQTFSKSLSFSRVFLFREAFLIKLLLKGFEKKKYTDSFIRAIVFLLVRFSFSKKEKVK